MILPGSIFPLQSEERILSSLLLLRASAFQMSHVSAPAPKLKDMLMGVKGAYVDFVVGMLAEAHNSKEKRDKIAHFIIRNPEASSSDVIEELYKNFTDDQRCFHGMG